MTFRDFFAKNTGQSIETEDQNNLYQCMDLAFAWCDEMDVPRETIRHAQAYEVWTKPRDSTLQYFDYIPNTPNGVPQEGDLVVFSQGVGPSGHISIATDKADAKTFTSFDQNWNGAPTSQLIEHAYEHVCGWLHRKQPGESESLALLTAQHTIVEKEQEIVALTSQLAALKGETVEEPATVALPAMVLFGTRNIRVIPLFVSIWNFLKGKKTIIIGVLLIILGFLQNDSQKVLEGLSVIGLRLSLLSNKNSFLPTTNTYA